MIRAGDLRHRMAIQEETLTSDGIGSFTSVWTDVSGMDNVPFALWPLKVEEKTAFNAVGATMTHRIRMRYRDGVTAKMRGIFGTIGVPDLMPNIEDRDFSAASAWANVDLGGGYNETDDLTITANAASQYCTLLVASAPTTIGKRYRLSYDLANIVSTWKVRDFGGTQTLGTISANGTQSTLEFTAVTAGGLRLVAVAANSSGDFDNFKLQEIRIFRFMPPTNMGEKNVALEIIVEEITDQ
ncbi:MAG TPA: head-tail adaptor protein [Pricia sp.]|nr:head-tail adaptor protein [Pricia sp.]